MKAYSRVVTMVVIIFSGYSCKLLAPDMPLLILNEENMEDTRENLERQINEFGEDIGNENYVGLVIDGKVSKIIIMMGCERLANEAQWPCMRSEAVSFKLQLYKGVADQLKHSDQTGVLKGYLKWGILLIAPG